MKIYRTLSLALALFLLAGCTGNSALPGLPSTPTAPPPLVSITRAPEPVGAVQPFLEAWKAGDYATMYGLLTQDSQKAISADDFANRYRDAMTKLTLKELQYTLGTVSINPTSAVVNFHLTYQTNLIGSLDRDLSANLKLENGQWRIAWEDGLIMPDLRGGNHLEMNPEVPARGNIYDRHMAPIVTQGDAVALALIPGQINTDTEGSLLSTLSDLVGLYPGTIAGLYANAGPDWYIPVGEVSQDDFKHKGGALAGFTGVLSYPYNTRLYANGIAPQAIGYISAIQKEEIDQYVRQGYSPASSVGRSGIEKWGENLLAGKTGGTLYVFDKDGKPITELGKSEPQPASSIALTIDKDLQFKSQKAIEGFRGAIVVMERNSGRVLAMVSSPSYDPNLFDTANHNSANGISNLVNDPNTPQLNRAAQSKYPLGSVFKVITFSAALESKTYTPETTYECGYHFTDPALPGLVFNDWTWEHYQNQLAAGDTVFTQPSGHLTLTEGLMRSCNPFFWSIGLDLYQQGRVTAVADMARGFGLGKATGIGEIEENPGNIPNPASPVDAVNDAIGQGETQVTPLQVARFMAAIGNGGTLYRPQLVESTIDPNGVVTQVFKPEAQGVLPITSQTLDALRTAMLAVVRNHRGTAYPRFEGVTANIPIYGKTGTAESGNGLSHAWFAGYTDAQNPDLPDIAIAVIAENAGEGSIIAAPIFKRVVEIYFTGNARSPYPWETSIGVTRTPTLPVTPTLQQP